jgi:homopolymeric O-antigen transport system permease protein
MANGAPMSVVVGDNVGGPVHPRIVPRRPAWLFSVSLDVLLGMSAYIASYQLRFAGDVATFLPAAQSMMPAVVGAQIVMLIAVGAYTPRPRVSWLSRVILGVGLGSAASAILIYAAVRFEGVSRLAFVSDSLLFSIAAIAWRSAWVLRSRARARAATRGPSTELIDRADEMTLAAVLASLYSYRGLVKALVLKDLKLKYRGSVFGFLWSLANPLLMIVVYTIAFKYILGTQNEMFVFYLMLGQLSWTLFASSAMMSTGSIVDNAGLLRTVRFPRAILPIGTVLFNFAQYVLTLAVFLPVMVGWYRVPFAEPMLLFPIVLALQVLFTTGVALILATITVFFRDIRHLVEIALAVMFWMTPIIYQLDQVPERLRLVILLSPVSPFVVANQKLFFYREWPEVTIWLLAGAYAAGALVFGAMLILALDDRFTEQL